MSNEFKAIFDLDLKKFDTAINNAGKKVDVFSKKMESSGKNLSKYVSGPIAAVAASASLLVKNFADVGDEIDKASQRAGLTAESYQELGFALGQFGMKAGESERALERLNQRKAAAAAGNEQLSSAFDNLGISITGVDGKLKSTDDLFDETIHKLSQFDDASEAAAAGSAIFGQRLVRRMIPAIQGGSEEIEKLREEARQSGIIMSGESVQSAAAFSDQIDVLTRKFKMITANIGASFMPVIIKLAEYVEANVLPIMVRFGGFIEKLVKRFEGLSTETQGTIGAIIGLAAALGPAVLAFGKLISVLKYVSVGFASISAPALAIGAIVAGAAYLIITNWEQVAAYFTSGKGAEVFESVKVAANELYQSLKTLMESIYNLFNAVWGVIGDDVIGYVSDMFDGISSIFTSIFNTLSGIMQDLRVMFNTGLEGVFKAFMSIFARVYKNVVDIVALLVNNILSQISRLVKYFDSDWAESIDRFAETVGTGFGKASQYLEKYTLNHEKVQSAEEKTAETVDKTNSKQRERLDILAQLNEAERQQAETIENSLSTYDEYIEKLDIIGKQGTALGSNFDEVAASIQATEQAIKNMIEEGVDPFDSRIIEMRENLENLKDGISQVDETATNFADHFKDGMEQMASGMASGTRSIEDMGKKMISTLIDVAGAALIKSIMSNPAIPFPVNVGIAAGAGGIISGLSSGITQMADGGIVGRSTIVNVGEYIGARNDPEFIAPISKLNDLQGGSTMEGVATGENIIFSMQRTSRRFNRMGE